MRVAIADDNEQFRRALAQQLNKVGADVVIQATNGEDIVQRVRQEAVVPDVVILDIAMPPGDGTGGLIAAERLRQVYPKLARLVLSAYAETDYAIRLFEPDPRSTGYLIKDNVADITVLSDALERVRSGETVLDPDIVKCLTSPARMHPKVNDRSRLTSRETEILQLITQGKTNKSICRELAIAPQTLSSHIANICTKYDIPAGTDECRRVVLALKSLRSPPS